MTMNNVFLRTGLIVRELMYKLLKELMPNGYTLVTIRTEYGELKLYTHYEGLQVIDEVFILGQYSKGLAENNRVAVDLGAHIGTFTVLFAYTLYNSNKDGIVISIEPSLLNYTMLLNNIKLNRLESYVKPLRVAIAPERSVIETEWLGIKERVSAITMYDVINLLGQLGYDNIDLLKIDIEGYELNLLINNNSWLNKVKSIVMEIHPWIYGYKGVELITRQLKNNGFDIKIVKRKIRTSYATLNWLMDVHSPYAAILTPW